MRKSGTGRTLLRIRASRCLSWCACLGGFAPAEAPRTAQGCPELLRELARIGNNLNQLAHAANRKQPLEAAPLLIRLIEIDRELAAIRAAHERPADAD